MAQAQANQNQNVLTDGVSRTRLKWDRHKHCTVIAVPWVDEFYFDAVFNRADTAQGRNLLPGQDATKTREAARDSLKTYYVALHKLAQDICEENTNLTKAQKESIKATRHILDDDFVEHMLVYGGVKIDLTTWTWQQVHSHEWLTAEFAE